MKNSEKSKKWFGLFYFLTEKIDKGKEILDLQQRVRGTHEKQQLPPTKKTAYADDPRLFKIKKPKKPALSFLKRLSIYLNGDTEAGRYRTNMRTLELEERPLKSKSILKKQSKMDVGKKTPGLSVRFNVGTLNDNDADSLMQEADEQGASMELRAAFYGHSAISLNAASSSLSNLPHDSVENNEETQSKSGGSSHGGDVPGERRGAFMQGVKDVFLGLRGRQSSLQLGRAYTSSGYAVTWDGRAYDRTAVPKFDAYERGDAFMNVYTEAPENLYGAYENQGSQEDIPLADALQNAFENKYGVETSKVTFLPFEMESMPGGIPTEWIERGFDVGKSADAFFSQGKYAFYQRRNSQDLDFKVPTGAREAFCAENMSVKQDEFPLDDEVILRAFEKAKNLPENSVESCNVKPFWGNCVSTHKADGSGLFEKTVTDLSLPLPQEADILSFEKNTESDVVSITASKSGMVLVQPGDLQNDICDAAHVAGLLGEGIRVVLNPQNDKELCVSEGDAFFPIDMSEKLNASDEWGKIKQELFAANMEPYPLKQWNVRQEAIPDEVLQSLEGYVLRAWADGRNHVLVTDKNRCPEVQERIREARSSGRGGGANGGSFVVSSLNESDAKVQPPQLLRHKGKIPSNAQKGR